MTSSDGVPGANLGGPSRWGLVQFYGHLSNASVLRSTDTSVPIPKFA